MGEGTEEEREEKAMKNPTVEELNKGRNQYYGALQDKSTDRGAAERRMLQAEQDSAAYQYSQASQAQSQQGTTEVYNPDRDCTRNSQVGGPVQSPMEKTIANQIEELEKSVQCALVEMSTLEEAVYIGHGCENGGVVPRSMVTAELIAGCAASVRELSSRIRGVGRTVGGQLQ